jgi:poly(3-hydroxybutyrate) depolymerase
MFNSQHDQKLKSAVDPKKLREKYNMEDVLGTIPSMPVPVNLTRKSGMISGNLHTWYEYVPSSYNKSDLPVPLLVSLHGGGNNGEGAAKATTFTTIADRENFIILYPEATLSYEDEEGRHHEWNAFYMNNKSEDETYWLKLLIEKICNDYRIDRSRIYLTGHSNGDQMALQLAVTYPELFAACAGLNGPTHPDKIVDMAGNRMKPSIPLPYLRWNGERDPLGGGDLTRTQVNQLLNKYWIEINGCTTNPQFHLDGKLNTIIYQSDCGAEVRFVEYKGGPHRLNIELASVVWYEFFYHFARGLDGSVIVLNRFDHPPSNTFTAALVDGRSHAMVKGNIIKLDPRKPNVAAFIIEKCLFAPIHFIADIFGAKVEWNQELCQATLIYKEKNCQITADHPALWVDHKVFPFEVNPKMIEDSLWVPIQELVERLFEKKVSIAEGVVYISDRDTEISNSIAHEIKKMIV